MESVVADAVSGVRDASGRIDAHMLDQCAYGFERALFFVPSFSLLRGIAEPLRRAAEASGIIDAAELPGRALLSTATAGIEPISLSGIFKISRAVEVVISIADSASSSGAIGASMRKHFASTPLTANSVIPSFYTLNQALFESIVRRFTADRDALSELLLSSARVAPGARRYFLRRLEDGYSSTADGRRGVYKITEFTARLLYDKLCNLTEAAPPFDELMSVDVLAGPRNGQMSRALPRSWGNIIPDRFGRY